MNLQHLPVDHLHFTPRDFDPITISKLFTAFEKECHKNKELYEQVDCSPTEEIKTRILESIKAEKKSERTDEENKFIDDSIDRISQLGTAMGQKAKLLRVFESVYPVLKTYLPHLLVGPEERQPDYKELAKNLLSIIPSLRATVLHDGNYSLISHEQTNALIILEILVYIQMLRRAGIRDGDINRIIGFVFEFTGGNYTYLTPD